MSTTPPEANSPGSSDQKKKKEHVEPPPVEEYRQLIAVEREARDLLFKKLNELSAKINEQRSGQSSYSDTRDKLRRDMDAASRRVDELEAQRSKLFAAIEETQKSARERKTNVQSLRRGLGYNSEQQIDAKIRELELVMLSKRLPVTEENKIIEEIKKLKNSKPLVKKYAEEEADATLNSESAVLPLRTQFEKVREELRLAQQKKRDIGDSVRALYDSNQKSLSPVKGLVEEKEKIQSQIAVHKQEEARLNDDLADKRRKYQAYIAQNKQADLEKRLERKKRDDVESRKESLMRELEDIEEEYISPEYQLTHQAVLYLRKLVARLDAATSSTHSPPTAATTDSPASSIKETDEDGMVLIKRKNEREEQYYFAPTRKVKGEKKVKKQQIVSGSQPLSHDISTISDFAKLKLSLPLTLEECSPCLAALETKLSQLKASQEASTKSSRDRKKELSVQLAEVEAKLLEMSASATPVA